MLRLPTIVDTAPGVRLPLAAISAERLAAASLNEAGAARAESLGKLLADDAVLLAWCLARVWQCDRRELASLSAAAEWLAEAGLSELAAESWQGKGLAPAELAAKVRELLPPSLGPEVAGLLAGLEQQIEQAVGEGASSLSPLAAALPELLARLARLDTLELRFAEQLEEEKLLAMKELAYGAGHEINNPLANIATRAQTLLRDETDPERRRKLATMNSQAFRAHEMIADMMLFAHPPRPEPVETDLAELLARVVAEWSPQAAEQGTLLTLAAGGPPVLAEVDANQIALAIAALVRNSLEALGLGGKVDIELGRAEAGAEEVTISVADSGPGIPPEVRRHLFDPFYSGREAGRGLGFGLSKAWRIAERHGGRLTVEEAEGGGARLVMRLPLAGGVAAAEKTALAKKSALAKTPTV